MAKESQTREEPKAQEPEATSGPSAFDMANMVLDSLEGKDLAEETHETSEDPSKSEASEGTPEQTEDAPKEQVQSEEAGSEDQETEPESGKTGQEEASADQDSTEDKKKRDSESRIKQLNAEKKAVEEKYAKELAAMRAELDSLKAPKEQVSTQKKNSWTDYPTDALEQTAEYYTTGEGREDDNALVIVRQIDRELARRETKREFEERDKKTQEEKIQQQREQYTQHVAALYAEDFKDTEGQFTKDATEAFQLVRDMPNGPLIASWIASGMQDYRARVEKAQNGNGKQETVAPAAPAAKPARRSAPSSPGSLSGSNLTAPAPAGSAEKYTDKLNRFYDSGGKDDALLGDILVDALEKKK